MSDVRLSHWYPKVRDVVPTPETRLVKAPPGLIEILDGETPDGFDMFTVQIARAALSVGGPPFFLRTDHVSGKHDWTDTCFVPAVSRDVIAQHVYNLTEWSFGIAFPGMPTDTWAVREMLPVTSPFTAFRGFPVSKERRYWLADGAVVGHHPYWIPDAVEEGHPPHGWREALDRLNAETPDEVAHLTEQSRRVGAVLPGRWSVDWLHTERGWFLIDMAPAEQSWVWEGHPNAPVWENAA